jgi:curli biogenesis system outer membrane secretion channel CsgG
MILLLRGLSILVAAASLAACGDDEAGPTSVDDQESPEANSVAPHAVENAAVQIFTIDDSDG